MSGDNKISLTCDICKHPAKLYDNLKAAKDAGWIEVGVECFYVERSFSEAHVCPHCAKAIEKQLKGRRP